MDQETMKAVIGVALVVGFVILIVCCVIADKTANKRFDKKIKAKYHTKETAGPVTITENNEVMIYLGSGTLHGYKIWDVKDISYFGMNTLASKATGYRVAFEFLDDRKKAMKGKYLTPSHKPVLQHKISSFYADNDITLTNIYEMLKKYNPDIRLVRNGKEEEE